MTGRSSFGDGVLPEWLEGGIDPLLRQNEEDALPLAPPLQAISSASSTATRGILGSAGATPVVLTPTGSSTPLREAKESWRDLDKFYASDNGRKDSESGSEDSDENWEEDNGAHDSEGTEDTADYESSEEDEK